MTAWPTLALAESAAKFAQTSTVHALEGVPVITSEPISKTVFPSVGVNFVVSATGVGLSYQWYRIPVAGGEVAVTNGGFYSGATTSTLFAYARLTVNGERYRCVVSNSSGSVSSSLATLSVFAPAVVKIAAGRDHSLRADVMLTLFASGNNASGQFGDGTTESWSTTNVSLGSNTIAEIAAGEKHSLFLMRSKDLYTTGFNGTGQLGNGTTTSRSTPIKISSDVVGVAAGLSHSVYLKADGTLWGTGNNDYGQLGNGTRVQRTFATQIASDVVDVAAGTRQTLFIKSDRTLWAAGNLDGSDMPVMTPVQIATQVAKVAAGGYHMLFVKTDGTLWAMGYNVDGQLGDGSTTTRTSPVQIASGVKSVAAGFFHSVFIKIDDTLWAMGSNSSGQLGDGTSSNRVTPVEIAGGVTTVAANEAYTLFTKNDGSYWAIGSNANWRFGVNTPASVNVPLRVFTGLNVLPAVPVGLVAPIATNGKVHLTWQPAADTLSYEVWRSATNDSATATRIATNIRWAIYDDLEAGSGIQYYWIKSVNAAGTSDFSAVAVASAIPVILTQPQSQAVNMGWSATFSVMAAGSQPLSYQWQFNGTDIPGATNSWLTVDGVTVAKSGTYTVRISNSAGSVLSEPATFEVRTPVVISEHPQHQTKVAGENAAFSVTASGSALLVFQWQRQRVSNNSSSWSDLVENEDYSGVTTSTLTVNGVNANASGEQFRCKVTNPVDSKTSNAAQLHLRTAAGALSVAAGERHSLFLRGDATLWGAGYLYFDPTGGADTPTRVVPIQISSEVTAVSSGTNHRLILKTDGSLWAMGNNFYRQLGDGSTVTRTAPIQVATGVVSAAVSDGRSYFTKSDGTLWAVGLGSLAGTGVTTMPLQPTQIAMDVRAVAVGKNHVLVLKSSGALWVAGAGYYGQLGLGMANTAPTYFTQVATNVASIAASEMHSLFVKTDGTLWGMGENESGALGDGSGTSRFTPVQIATNVVWAVAASRSSYFVKTDGWLWAMGQNSYGSLGDGTTTKRLSPVQIAQQVTTLAAYGTHALFTKSDGTLWAMGSNFNGQLGDGTTINRPSPVQITDGPLVIPGAPINLTATDATTYTGTHVNWEASPSALSYELWRATSDSSASASLFAARVESNYYHDTTGDPGVVYHYWAKAVNPAGISAFSGSDAGAKAIAVAPVITTQPVAQTINLRVPATASFDVQATGTGPLLYQWRKNGVNLENSFYVHGAQTPALSFTDFGHWDGGTITVVVSNAAGSVESTPVLFKVGDSPSVYQHPQSLTCTWGEAAVFSVVPIGGSTNPTPNFQWRKDGTPIPGATGATLTIPAVQLGDAGTYSVELSNDFGAVVSNSAVLTVNQKSQTIGFEALADRAFSSALIPLIATASSGLPVEFTVVSGPAILVGQSLQLTGSGQITIRAAQSGNDEYAAAVPVDRVLMVTTNVHAWQTEYFSASELLDPAISGFNADPDNDGLSNLLEYALGLDPKSASAAAMPILESSAVDWSYTYERPHDRTDIVYAVEVSSDLTAWSTNGVSHALISSHDGLEVWRATHALAGADRAFFRLKITTQ